MARTLFMALILLGCGTEVKQTQGLEGSAELIIRIEVAFPECAGIEDDRLRVECVKEAASVLKALFNVLPDDKQEILDELGMTV